ncbi:MAG: ATP phosphoribosyltransferase [Clostridia bacterium]|nr:ATP phosphoribosyltransferase [Clostridia bacterium]
MLNIALPKGRLGDKVYKLLDKLGYSCPELLEDNRKLVFENKQSSVRYFLVKPTDVATYVERGAADIGVVGKDILREKDYDLYELMDLKFGKCRMAIAARNGYQDDPDSVLRVATKYVNTAKRYFASVDREIEIIELHGSIELAPILDLSDVIVDIVETGSTLRENDMSVIKEIEDISARLIANKSSYRFKEAEIRELAEKIGKEI